MSITLAQKRSDTLILFSFWFPDEKENSFLWGDYYISLLSNELRLYDKIVCSNFGCPPSFINRMAALPGVIACLNVTPAMHVNSDAAGYQLALQYAESRLENYKSVLFLQSKGVTKKFADLEGFRWYFGNKLLNRAALDELSSKYENALTAVFCHPPTFSSDISTFSQLIEQIAPKSRVFMLNATYTVFAASATLVEHALSTLGQAFYEENLGRRFTRFYFELTFPSLLVTLGGDLRILCESHPNANLNPFLSYNYDLPHSSELVWRLYQKYRSDPHYVQHPVPMMFGTVEELQRLSVSFSV